MRALAGALLSVLLLLTGAAPALAHAQLEDSTPGEGSVLPHAPGSADFDFDEHVRPVEGATVLIRPDGAATVLSPRVRDRHVVAPLPADLSDGSYALSYRVISADGHPVAGAVTFSIGAPSTDSAPPHDGRDTGIDAETHAEEPSVTSIAVDVLTIVRYPTLLVMVGLLLCAVLVTRGQVARSVLRSPRVTRTLRTLAVVVAVASVLLVPASAIDAAGGAPWTAGLDRQQVIGAGLVLAGCALILLAGGARRPALSLPGALLALAAPMLVGHSSSESPRALMLAADAGHLLAGAVWSGGLLGTIVVLTTLHRARRAGHAGTAAPPVGTDTAAAVAVIRRFSLLALVSVLVLGASGVVMALLILDAPSSLVTTAWGRTLMVKLIIVAVALGLAAWNRTRLLPAITGAAAPWERLLRLMRREAALLLGALVVTGALVNLSPHEHSMDASRASAATGTHTTHPQKLHAASQGLTVDGALDPGTRGRNTLNLELAYEGKALDDPKVHISATQKEHGIGPIVVHPHCEDGSSTCTADLDLPTSGTWQIQVTAEIDEFTTPVALSNLEIG